MTTQHTTFRRQPGALDGRLFRHANAQDEEQSSYVCECAAPEWVGCGPLFPAVRMCDRCGRADRAQLGTWPERLDTRGA